MKDLKTVLQLRLHKDKNAQRQKELSFFIFTLQIFFNCNFTNKISNNFILFLKRIKQFKIQEKRNSQTDKNNSIDMILYSNRFRQEQRCGVRKNSYRRN